MALQLGMRSTVSIEDKAVWARIARALNEWNTVADVGASSYGAPRRASERLPFSAWRAYN